MLKSLKWRHKIIIDFLFVHVHACLVIVHKLCHGLKGRGYQGLGHDSTEAFVLKGVTMGGEGCQSLSMLLNVIYGWPLNKINIVAPNIYFQAIFKCKNVCLLINKDFLSHYSKPVLKLLKGHLSKKTTDRFVAV